MSSFNPSIIYSLGKPIGVYVNTFNNMEQEYLVNLDYLEKILPEFKIERKVKRDFSKKEKM